MTVPNLANLDIISETWVDSVTTDVNTVTTTVADAKLPVIVQRVVCTSNYTTTTSTAQITGMTATIALQTGDLVVFFGSIDAQASGATGTLACTLYAGGGALAGAATFTAGAATDRLTLGFHPEHYTAGSNGNVTFDLRAVHTNSSFTIRTNTSFTIVVYR